MPYVAFSPARHSSSSRPLSAGALSAERVFTDLFDPTTEFDVGHIRLAREADLIVVAPATADLLAKMAGGPRRRPRFRGAARHRPPDPGGAGDEPADVGAPGNPAAISRSSPATASPWLGRTPARWQRRGKPASGGWRSRWRSRRPPCRFWARTTRDKTLAGKRMIVTSGPTHEPIDPVRYIANRSSGKQGHAIAAAAAAAGADVTLVIRPGEPARSARREHRQGRDRAGHVCRGYGGTAGGRRGVCRRGGRLARGSAQCEQDQEAGRRNRPRSAWSRIPISCAIGRARREHPAAPGHWLCRRDRAHHRAREGQACAQRMRLDRRQ